MKAINVEIFLNINTKSQFIFLGIHYRVDLIFQAKTYIMKYGLIKDVIGKINYILIKVLVFNDIF